jgi:sugar phosphate permease
VCFLNGVYRRESESIARVEITTKTVEVAAAAQRTAARWSLVAPTLFMLVVINQLDKTNIAVIVADRRFLFDMALTKQPARIGLLSTIFFFGYGAGLFAWGFVVDQLGPRRSAMIGVCGWALTTMWCGIAHGIYELYFARFVLGVTEGCIWPVCNTYSSRWFPLRERGRIQSLWVNGNQVGLALGVPIVAYLTEVGGWRVVFWALGVGSLALLLPMLFFLAADEPGASRYANGEEQRYIASHRAGGSAEMSAEHCGKLGALLTDSSFWIVTLCHAGTVATLFGLATWIPTYLTQVRGIPFDALKAWIALSYLLPITVALCMGYFADRTMRPAMVSAGTSAVVAAMVLASVTVSNTVVCVLLLVTVLAAPMIYGAMNASIMQGLVQSEQIGRATGVFVGAGNLVGGLAPVIIGYLIGVSGGRYLPAFGFISAVNLVLVILYSLMDLKSKRATEAFAG